MKRFLSLFLAVAILSVAVPVLAAETSGLEAAILEVKARLDIGEYEDFESEVAMVNGRESYLLNWSNRTDDSYEYLGVGYSDGVILSYECSYNGKNSSDRKFSNISRSEAEKIAEDFIKKINPTICENIEIKSEGKTDLTGNSHYFYLNRYHNGIPVLGEGGHISISKDNGQVRYFSLEYDTQITFENNDNIIDVETAKTEYAKKISPELYYAYHFDYEKKDVKVFPEYMSQDRNIVIDAATAEKYEIPQKYYYSDSTVKQESATLKANGAADAGFSKAELDEISEIDGLISSETAENIAREKKNIDIEKRYVLDNFTLSSDYVDLAKYLFNLRFSDKSKDKTEFIRVNVDAKDGTIMSFNKPGDYSAKNQDKENEKKIAENALQEFTNNKYKNLEYKEDEQIGNVTYVRKENGIEVLGQQASFFFDGNDKLVSYNLTYTDSLTFPSIENVLSVEEAVKKVAEDIDFTLFYAVDYENKNAKQVYGFFEDGDVLSFVIDPFTGKRIDYAGEEIIGDTLISYNDIDGHYAEDKFLKLAEYDIGFTDGVLLPEQQITQAEYMNLLNEVFGYSSGIDEIYARAYTKGIIKAEERDDTSPVTRENAAIFMIREMGAEEYAKYNEIYAEPFADVTENKGYIALLKAMGVVSGDGNGNFNPKNTITRGEALIIIYNYLSR